MSERKEEELELFNQKYNCAQSVLKAYSDKSKMDEESILKITSGFGGGIAGFGDICGAVSGGVMAISLKYGHINPNEIDKKEETKAKIREFIKKLKDNHKSVDCRDLLTEDNGMV